MRSTVNTQLRRNTQIVLASNSKLVLLDCALSVSHPKESLPVHYLPFLLCAFFCFFTLQFYCASRQQACISDMHRTIDVDFYTLYAAATIKTWWCWKTVVILYLVMHSSLRCCLFGCYLLTRSRRNTEESCFKLVGFICELEPRISPVKQ